MRGADITERAGDRIVYALHICGQSLTPLSAESRLIVLRALCATFLTDEPPAPGPSPSDAQTETRK